SKMEQSSCTEDRITHTLERCLSDLGLNSPDKQLWSAGLCINRWCLEELVKRDPHNFLILLQQILRKTKEVLLQCQYELVAPLALLFSSTLLKVPYLAPDCGVLQEAYLLFHCFLSWPEPCCSASKRLLLIIQQELRAPGISFQRLVREEQGLDPEIHSSKIMTVLLVSPNEDVPPEVKSVSEQLSSPRHSHRDITISLILHALQAALGAKHRLHTLHTVLQETDAEDKKVDSEFENHRISTASSSSRDSMFSSYSLSSSWSVPSTQSWSSGVDSDYSEDTEEGQDSQPNPRRKPKKKSKSLLRVDRLSSLFKSNRSPSVCRRVQSMGYHGDVIKDFPASRPQFQRSNSLPRPLLGSTVSPPVARLDLLSPKKHMCVRRRPILSCDEGDVPKVTTLVRVVVFGGDKEAGRLARAYSDLQQKESKCPRLTRTCKLQFYFVPTKKRIVGSPGGGQIATEEQTGTPVKATPLTEDNTTDIAQMMGMIDPWYERSVLSLLSLSSEILCQSLKCVLFLGALERLPLLADLVLYYCRHADQPALVQLYQAELTLAGGERRREVFIHSLELGHTAGTRAVKAMGAASKRFGIDGEREAVPLTLGVAYNKVAVSGRSQWTQAEMVCTSINLYKACKKPELLDSRMESLQLTMTEVLKRQSSKSKKGYNQHISISEVKVDKVQVSGEGDGTTFAVCLDQDEKKIIQSVTRCSRETPHTLISFTLAS
uniref:Phosphoinositide 3-kinase regulatory subunit 5 n=1 Tax=Myripristis murdjan TaxID=586833 RepID=A0A667X246_9TELE